MLRVRSMVRARNFPLRKRGQGLVPRNVSTPQQLAGSTISQTTNGNVKLAPGLAFQYDANGKAIGLVRINQGGAGIPQGQGISYDASGKPSMGAFPATTGGSGGSTPSSTTSSAQNSGTFGDSLYQQATGPEGIIGAVDRGVNNRNFQDQQYLIQMGYTPEQAAQAIRSRTYSITDPNNPTGPRINKDVGSLQAGALDWNTVDLTTPNSRAAAMVKYYRGAVQGTTTGMAAGGHGRSGAALTAQQQNSSNFAGQQAQWNQDLAGYQFGSNDARLGFGSEANRGINQQMQDFIGRQANVPTIESPEGNRTAVPATGSFILGNQAGNGLPSYDEWAAQYGGAGRFPKLFNGWSVEIKDGRIVRFIPPGGA